MQTDHLPYLRLVHPRGLVIHAFAAAAQLGSKIYEASSSSSPQSFAGLPRQMSCLPLHPARLTDVLPRLQTKVTMVIFLR
jgi:hypothetical protein